MGASVAGMAAITLPKIGIGSAKAASTLTQTDIEVLQFALNLEYLEAEFYLKAATGVGLPADLKTGSGTRGEVTGGTAVPFTNPNIKALAFELAEEEQLHVAFIRQALEAYGQTPVAQPAIDIQTSFTTAARAAGLVGPGQTFNAYESDLNFLLAAYIFEDVGVTAYGGAAPLVSNAILGYAAGIMAVEAYHAGAIRMLAYNNELVADTKAISKLRATLDGTYNTGNPDDTGIKEHMQTRITDRDANAIAFTRTTSQVLSVVYGSPIMSNGMPSVSQGLFFPNGMNGAIH
jgi:hypothetical protein